MLGATTRIERERKEKHIKLKEAYERMQAAGNCMILDDLQSIFKSCKCEKDPDKRWGERDGKGVYVRTRKRAK